MRWRLRVWRRKRCIRRGHPMAAWSPIVLSYSDGTDEIVQRAWRCSIHDKENA